MKTSIFLDSPFKLQENVNKLIEQLDTEKIIPIPLTHLSFEMELQKMLGVPKELLYETSIKKLRLKKYSQI